MVRGWDSAVGTLQLVQLYVGPNSLWAPLITVIMQIMYCLVLWLCWHASHIFLFVCPTKIYMLKSLLLLTVPHKQTQLFQTKHITECESNCLPKVTCSQTDTSRSVVDMTHLEKKICLHSSATLQSCKLIRTGPISA